MNFIQQLTTAKNHLNALTLQGTSIGEYVVAIKGEAVIDGTLYVSYLTFSQDYMAGKGAHTVRFAPAK